jgi:hypothetical protein
MKNPWKIIRYQLLTFFQEILDLFFGPLLFWLVHLENKFCYFIDSEDGKFKNSSHIFETKILASSHITQENNISSPVPFVSSNDPLTSSSF